MGLHYPVHPSILSNNIVNKCTLFEECTHVVQTETPIMPMEISSNAQYVQNNILSKFGQIFCFKLKK